MTSNPLRLACLSICLQAAFAHAQDADAASRAQRDASNPLRMIIEASKLKPRQKAPVEPEAAPKPVPEKAVARTPVAKPAAPLAAPLLAQPAAPDRAPGIALAAETAAPRPAGSTAVEQASHSVASTEVAAAAEPVEVAKAAAVGEAEPPAATAGTSASPSPAAAVAAPDAGSAPPGAAPSAATQVALAAPSLSQPNPANATSSPPAVRATLQLADYIEPVLPDRVRRRLQGDATVVVRFTVNADGSVADVAVRSSSDRALDPIALDAVSQWRYKPIASAQPHAVELVFKAAN